VKFKPNANQTAYESNKLREQQCAIWLKTRHKPVRKWIGLSVLSGTVNGALLIIQAYLLAILMHRLVIEQHQWLQFKDLLVALLLIAVLRSCCVYALQTTGFKAAAAVKQQLRQQVVDQFERLEWGWFKHQQSGHLAATTQEHCEALDKYFARYVPQKFIAVLVPVLIILATFPVNWIVAMIFLVTGPLVPLFMALIGMGAAAASRSQFLQLAWMGSFYLDRLQGLSTLKLFGRAEDELVTIRGIADDFRQKTMAVLRIAFMSSAILEFFSAVAVALVAVYVGLGLLGLVHFGPAQSITLQEAVFVLLLAPEFFQPLRQLAVNYHDRAAALGAAHHILRILEQDVSTATNTTKGGSEFCIELCAVTKMYSQRCILDQVNLQVIRGEKIALVGETGVGKSTLLSILLGSEAVSSGRALIDGNLLTRQISQQQIAWLGQRPAIFYGSISDNIRLFDPAISPQQIIEAAQSAGVMDYAQTLERGLDTLIGEQGYGLSGGQVQRIALARVLLKDAPIILLDEPTANLDNANKKLLMQRVEQLFTDKTVLIATHDPEVIVRMERVVHLTNGKLQ
jgi:ATP-binding cassette, subfamily C, bacterial CydD